MSNVFEIISLSVSSRLLEMTEITPFSFPLTSTVRIVVAPDVTEVIKLLVVTKRQLLGLEGERMVRFFCWIGGGRREKGGKEEGGREKEGRRNLLKARGVNGLIVCCVGRRGKGSRIDGRE